MFVSLKRISISLVIKLISSRNSAIRSATDLLEFAETIETFCQEFKLFKTASRLLDSTFSSCCIIDVSAVSATSCARFV